MSISPRSSRGFPVGALAPPGWCLLLLTWLLIGCITYQPAPIEPLELLRQFNAEGLVTDEDERQAAQRTAFDAADGFDARELAALAVVRNPSLRVLRAQTGVASARLVEAGLLPNPELSWDSINVLADQWVEGDATRVDYVSGIALTWSLPRPGEIDAREGVVRGQLEEAQYTVLRAEWQLTRSIHAAYLDLLAAQARLHLNDRQVEIARRAVDFFTAALEVKAATALEANLVQVELTNLLLDRSRLEVEEQETRQALNALVGLAPDATLNLQVEGDPFIVLPDLPLLDLLLEEAMQRRPDLLELLARHHQAEDELRLAVAQQWPEITIGTVLGLTLPFFTRFNKPAIASAFMRREVARQEVSAAVFELRAEANAAMLRLTKARQQVEYFEHELRPTLDESLRLTEQAFQYREVTLFEILTAQRQVLAAHGQNLEARIEMAKARVVLESVNGSLLDPARGDGESVERGREEIP
ncbi:MAG: TolC family protein [Planctomycetota bacterium]